MPWLLKLLNDCLANLLLAVVDSLGSFLDNIFDWIWKVNESLKINALMNYVVAIAIGFVVLCAIKQGLDIYVFQTEGDADADPLELITRSAIAVAVIYCGDFVVLQLLKFSSTLTDEVTAKISSITSDKVSSSFSKVVDTFYNGTVYKTKTIGFVMILLCVSILIAMIIFIFHATKRGAELILFRLLLPLVAIDLLTTNKERWNAFKNELLICIFGYVLQILSFNVFTHILALSAKNSSQIVYYVIAALGWLMMVISTPKWLEKFVYTSGIGNGAKGGVRSAAFLVPQLLRR